MSTGDEAPAKGEILKNWRKRDGQYSYALRVRHEGRRVYMRLGREIDGWNDHAARAELSRILNEIAAGTWNPPAPEIEDTDRDPGFHEFASWWLSEREPAIGQSAYDDYLNLLSRHLLPRFSALRLSQITYERIARYRTAKQLESKRLQAARDRGEVLKDRSGRPLRPFGPRQINASVALLAQILARAVKSEAFAITHNPARERDLRVRRKQRAGRRHLEADEVIDVLDAAGELDVPIRAITIERGLEARRLRDELQLPWKEIGVRLGCALTTAIWLYQQVGSDRSAPQPRRTLLAVLALSGLRSAEATELLWRHVDFTHGRIVIANSKTDAGRREVQMSAYLRGALGGYHESLGEVVPDALLFPTRTGRARTRQNVNSIVIAPAVRLAEDARAARGDAPLPPNITAHTFRRTYVTLSAQFGRSLAYVQSQVGHTDVNTTNRHYLQGSARETDAEIQSLLRRLLAP